MKKLILGIALIALGLGTTTTVLAVADAATTTCIKCSTVDNKYDCTTGDTGNSTCPSNASGSECCGNLNTPVETL